MHLGKLAWFGAIVVFMAACQPKEGPAEPKPRAKRYKAIPADEWTGAELAAVADPNVATVRSSLGSGTASRLDDRFDGDDRSGPKTSIVGGVQTEDFSSIAKLLASLPKDVKMREEHDPRITKKTMDRAPEEERNVRVKAWIYAIKYESDHDWHLIAGTDPARSAIRYFNAEVSALPEEQDGGWAPSFKTLLAVRRSLAGILDNDLPGPGSYRQYDPFPVVIEGSLFYDIDHAPGDVGPEKPPMKPTTAWEIHPITSLREP
jgi:hypothetical protein